MGEQKIESKPVADVTMILNVWKRNYLDEQLDALLKQTVLPKHIWIIRYENLTDMWSVVNKYLPMFPSITCIESEKNFKYFGRFSIVPFVETEFVWVLDDDIIPATPWLETALRKCKEYNALISCTGRIIPPGDFEPETDKDDMPAYFIGDEPYAMEHNICQKDTVVDFGCNSYFFKTCWMEHFWSIWPQTFASGEDMHLAATLKIQAGIKAIVPAQHSIEESGNYKKFYGADEHSSWVKPDFISIRREILQYLILEKKWKPLLWDEYLQSSNGSNIKHNNVLSM